MDKLAKVGDVNGPLFLADSLDVRQRLAFKACEWLGQVKAGRASTADYFVVFAITEVGLGARVILIDAVCSVREARVDWDGRIKMTCVEF